MWNFNNLLNSGWTGFKYAVKQLWHFIEIEIPELISNYRMVPRLMMVAYGWAFMEVITWFMALEDPNNAQAGLISVIVGAGAAWFGLYVNSTSTKHDPIAVPQQQGSMPTASTTTRVNIDRNETVTVDDELPPPVRRM